MFEVQSKPYSTIVELAFSSGNLARWECHPANGPIICSEGEIYEVRFMLPFEKDSEGKIIWQHEVGVGRLVRSANDPMECGLMYTPVGVLAGWCIKHRDGNWEKTGESVLWSD